MYSSYLNIGIVTPANLSFQWQREMKDKFREHFEVIRSDVLRANYGSNPWQDKNQVVTPVSWVSRIEDAKDLVPVSLSDFDHTAVLHPFPGDRGGRTMKALPPFLMLIKWNTHYLTYVSRFKLLINFFRRKNRNKQSGVSKRNGFVLSDYQISFLPQTFCDLF